MDTPYNIATGQVEPVSFPSLPNLLGGLRAWRNERRRMAEITRELNSYSDAELNDLGLRRGDIADVARGRYSRGR
jgi:uncharacterized protein YjiS (DUF1127 family)